MIIRFIKTRLHRKLHRKVMQTVQNHGVHRHVFRYAVASHFIHVAIAVGTIHSFDAGVAFAASIGTLLTHLIEAGAGGEECVHVSSDS